MTHLSRFSPPMYNRLPLNDSDLFFQVPSIPGAYLEIIPVRMCRSPDHLRLMWIWIPFPPPSLRFQKPGNLERHLGGNEFPCLWISWNTCVASGAKERHVLLTPHFSASIPKSTPASNPYLISRIPVYPNLIKSILSDPSPSYLRVSITTQ